MDLFYNVKEVNYDSEDWLSYSFGKAFRELRRFEEMSMNEVSEKSGVSQSYISQVENDVRMPSDKIIKQLAHALALGKTVQNIHWDFTDSEDSFFTDSYTSEFEVEKREQDFFELLEKIKTENENRNLKKHYLNSTKEGEAVNLSSEDIEFLNVFNKLDSQKKQQAIDYLTFLSKNK